MALNLPSVLYLSDYQPWRGNLAISNRPESKLQYFRSLWLSYGMLRKQRSVLITDN